MAIFKEIFCAECGQKTTPILRTQLKDGHYLCHKCRTQIPKEIQDLYNYDLDGYKELKLYMQESEYLSQVFRETHHFQSLHLDTYNGLFYIEGFSKKHTIFKLENVSEFNLEFQAVNSNEGFFNDYVTGKLYFKLRVDFPNYYVDEVMAENVKARADVRNGLFKKTFVHGNPDGMDDFIHYFTTGWEAAVNAKLMRMQQEYIPYQSQFGGF